MRHGPSDCFVQNTSTRVHPLPQPLPPNDTEVWDCEAKAKGLSSQKRRSISLKDGDLLLPEPGVVCLHMRLCDLLLSKLNVCA